MKHKRVALIGLDGSGKSTNIDKMKTDADYSDYEFMWVRWKPTLLKPAYWVLGKKIKNTKDPADTDSKIYSIEKNASEQKQLRSEYHAKSGVKSKVFKNPVVRGGWMTLALIDYFFQFYAKTLGSLIKKNSIIFDRFYLDLFVDQGINFGYSPDKIDHEIKKYRRLFPKMDQIVYIRVSPEICYMRKDDIPNMDYLLKRYDIYERLCQNPGWIVVDGEAPLEEVYAEIKRKILAKE